MKLKMFLGSLLWADDQSEFTVFQRVIQEESNEKGLRG